MDSAQIYGRVEREDSAQLGGQMVAKRAIQKATAERRGTAFVRVRMRTGDGLSPVPHSFALLRGASGLVLRERLACGIRNVGRDDPCGVLRFDCTRMVLAKVR